MSFAISGAGGASAPQVMSGASSYGSPAAKMNNLYQQIDTSNSGSIDLAQFQQAFATLNPPASFRAQGANAIFSQLDPNGTGSVSKSNFVQGMTGLMKSLRGGGASSATTSPNASTASDAGAQSLSQSLDSFLQLGVQSRSTNSGLGALFDSLA